MGTSIKLLGTARICQDKVLAMVAPVMINNSNPLFGVQGVYNGILVRSRMLGETMYYGSGAGKLPTASAVVADLIEAVQQDQEPVFAGWTNERQSVEESGKFQYRYFVRMEGDAGQKKEQIQQIFGNTDTIVLDGADEFAVLTEKLSEEEFIKRAVYLDGELQKAGEKGILQMIRAELP